MEGRKKDTGWGSMQYDSKKHKMNIKQVFGMSRSREGIRPKESWVHHFINSWKIP